MPTGDSGSKRRNSTSSTDTPVSAIRRSVSRRPACRRACRTAARRRSASRSAGCRPVRKPAVAATVTSSGGVASRTVRCASESSRRVAVVTRSILRERELGEELLVLGLVVDLHRREEAHDGVVEGDGEDEVGEPLVVQRPSSAPRTSRRRSRDPCVISRAARSTVFASGSSLLGLPAVSAASARMSSSDTPKSRPILM